jgi:hypothetical protein
MPLLCLFWLLSSERYLFLLWLICPLWLSELLPVTMATPFWYGSALSTSQIRASFMLLLPLVGNYKVRIWDDLQWYHFDVKIDQNPLRGSRVETRRRTDRRPDIGQS